MCTCCKSAEFLSLKHQAAVTPACPHNAQEYVVEAKAQQAEATEELAMVDAKVVQMQAMV